LSVEPEEITKKCGQATLTDFHKVKIIFVGEDANNTSKSIISLLGGFTVVVIALQIWIILDVSYNCVSVAKV